MASIDVFAGSAVEVEPVRSSKPGGPYSLVRLVDDRIQYFVVPRSVGAARAFASAINAACDAIEESERKGDEIDAEVESVIDLVTRWNGTEPPDRAA